LEKYKIFFLFNSAPTQKSTLPGALHLPSNPLIQFIWAAR